MVVGSDTRLASLEKQHGASADADDGSAEIQTLAIDATPPGQAQPDATNVQLVYPRR